MKKLLLALLLLPALGFGQGLPLKDGNSSTVADVEACGSLNCLRTAGPTTASGAGYHGLTGISGDAPATSNGKRYSPIRGTEGGGLQQALQNILWDDTFNATAQNINKYRFANASSMIGAQASGYMTLNAAPSVTTASANAALQTFKVFPLFGKSELRVSMSARYNQAPQANAVTEWGLFTATLPGTAAPTDGCFFRLNASAEFRGVCSFNGTETQTSAITAPSANVNHDYLLVIQTNTVLFIVDGVVSGTLSMLTDAPAQGQPLIQGSVPITFRHYNTATPPGLATQFGVTDVFVTSMGPDLARDFETAKAGFGHMANQGQNGNAALGTSANMLNAATPAASALTNTAISTGSPVGLGGVAHVLPTLAVGTDGILFSFQNPVGSVTQTPRNLIIKGVVVSGAVDVILTGGGLVYATSLAYGHTAISMATADLGSFVTGTTKAPRRIWIGTMSCIAAAAVGVALSNPINMTFDSPIVVAPGEFVAITIRNQGVVTTLGSVIFTAAFDAYYE